MRRKRGNQPSVGFNRLTLHGSWLSNPVVLFGEPYERECLGLGAFDDVAPNGLWFVLVSRHFCQRGQTITSYAKKMGEALAEYEWLGDWAPRRPRN